MFKEGDVFEYHHDYGCWEKREGSIGVIVGILTDGGEHAVYKINWISDTAPHLNSRKEFKDWDNQASLEAAELITRLEAPDATE